MSLTIDFNAYLKQESYRPASSGEDQRKRQADLELLRKVKDRLDQAERAGVDANRNEVFAHFRESSNARIAELEAELAEQKESTRIAIKARRRAESEARTYKADAQTLQTLREDGIVILPSSRAPQAKPAGPRIAAERRRRSREAYWAALVEQAAVLAGAAFNVPATDLVREVGRGSRFVYSIDYKMAKMSFYKSLHQVTAVQLNSMVRDFELKDKVTATQYIHRHKAVMLPEDITRQEKVCEALEAFALKLEVQTGQTA
jgi:hypothetical protein